MGWNWAFPCLKSGGPGCVSSRHGEKAVHRGCMMARPSEDVVGCRCSLAWPAWLSRTYLHYNWHFSLSHCWMNHLQTTSEWKVTHVAFLYPKFAKLHHWKVLQPLRNFWFLETVQQLVFLHCFLPSKIFKISWHHTNNLKTPLKN